MAVFKVDYLPPFDMELNAVGMEISVCTCTHLFCNCIKVTPWNYDQNVVKHWRTMHTGKLALHLL